MLEIGTLYDDKFTVIELLGKGGFGCVFKVQANNGEQYALKICLEQEEQIVRRFKREIRILKSVVSDRVIKIFEDGEANGYFYYTMPIADLNLAAVQDRIRRNELKCLEVFKEVCLGIKDLHDNGLIHRDIKPENVLLWKHKVLISDLGLGKFENRDSTILTASNVYMGSIGYIPPEFQYERGGTKNASVTSDIFQLGKLLYAIYMGENPIVIKEEGLPLSIATIINKTIPPQPDKRIQSINILIELVEKFIRQIVSPDPDMQFFSELEKAKSALSSFRYEQHNLEKLLESLLSKASDSFDFYSCFNQIPQQLLIKYASDFTETFDAIIKHYCKLLVENSELKITFGYVDSITDKLNVIYANSRSLTLKILLFETLADLATRFNRFYAMDVVKKIVKDTTNDIEAESLSVSISKNGENFQYIEIEDVKHHSLLLKAYKSIQIDQTTNTIDFLFD